MSFRAALCLLVIVLIALCASDLEARKLRVRIDLSDPSILHELPRGLDMLNTPRDFVDVIVTDAEYAVLVQTRAAVQVLDYDVEEMYAARSSDYHTFNEMVTELQSIATSYPLITQLSSLGQSYDSREIYLLEISDNPGLDEGEAEVLLIGLHHAREWPSLEICLFICRELTANYGSDPDVTDMVNNRRIFVVPCMNPDGYFYCHDQGHDWRKNRHYFSQYSTWGVDLNRNYGGSINGFAIGDWGDVSNAGTTHSPSMETYCGPGAFSELETQAVRDFLIGSDVTAGITFHTYSELVLWPWGYSGSHQTPDNTLMVSIGQGIASRITGQYGGTYDPGQTSSLYPVTGDTTDWAYGHGFYEEGKNCFFYTIESCVEFHPNYNQLQQVMDENYDGAFYLIEQADAIEAQTTPWPLPPLVDAPAYDSDGTYTVSWSEVNPDAGADSFQLDELSDLSVIADDLESGSGLWTLTNFTLSTARSHSSNHSFKSHASNGRTGTVTSVFPLPVEPGDTLSFWTWYDTETDWDYAAVEVSVDGRKWDDLDLFTGSSSGWKQKSYSLGAYAGRSIFIRFTYTTDEYTLDEGFYVDDISPTPDFGTVNTLASNTPDLSFPVTGNGNGDYYYRVKPRSPVHGWGDFSWLEKTIVDSGSQPPLPDIKIDGQDGPLTVPSTQTITMTVHLDPGDMAGVDMDWWVNATRTHTFWWTFPNTWKYNQARAYVGPLFNLASYTITQAQIPAGAWTFTFAVDPKNNIYEGTYLDTIDVTSY